MNANTMNIPLLDTCPACNQKGLLKADYVPATGNRSGRRRCQLCRKEEPRPWDRVLHLVCLSGVGHLDKPGVEPYYLDGNWSVEPFFDQAAALAHYYQILEEAKQRNPKDRWRPLTVSGHHGLVCWEHGPLFLFIQEKLVDVRPLTQTLPPITPE